MFKHKLNSARGL